MTRQNTFLFSLFWDAHGEHTFHWSYHGTVAQRVSFAAQVTSMVAHVGSEIGSVVIKEVVQCFPLAAEALAQTRQYDPPVPILGSLGILRITLHGVEASNWPARPYRPQITPHEGHFA